MKAVPASVRKSGSSRRYAWIACFALSLIGTIGLRQAVDALLTKNAHLAEAIAAQDDEIDRLYDQIYRELLTYMLSDPTTMDRATWLLWVAHNLERIGDRIQNICERTVYEATGVMREFTNAEDSRDP